MNTQTNPQRVYVYVCTHLGINKEFFSDEAYGRKIICGAIAKLRERKSQSHLNDNSENKKGMPATAS